MHGFNWFQASIDVNVNQIVSKVFRNILQALHFVIYFRTGLLFVFLKSVVKIPSSAVDIKMDLQSILSALDKTDF